jgi:DNA-binding transcriptional regulator YbjK
MARPSRRAALLDAAVAVIRRDGARSLTLDAVAAEAGVSKGCSRAGSTTSRAGSAARTSPPPTCGRAT